MMKAEHYWSGNVRPMADYARPDPHARIRELLDERNILLARLRNRTSERLAWAVLCVVTAVCFTALGVGLS